MTSIRVFAAIVLAAVPSLALGWELKPDPPRTLQQWTAGANLPLRYGERTDRIRFADQFGPFAVTMPAKGDERRVYSLAWGTETAKFKARGPSTFSSIEALSPDGAIWAGKVSLSDREVVLVETKTGAELGRVPCDFPQADLAFADSQTLVLLTLVRAKPSVVAIDARTGTVSQTVEIPSISSYRLSISPGGKYAAVMTKEGIEVVDLVAGTRAATLALPPAPKEIGPVKTLPGAAFSADGRSLAAVVKSATKGDGKLLTWNLDDGEQTTADVPRGVSVGALDVRPIQPVRSGGWIIDDEQIVSASGQSVRRIKREGLNLSRRLVLDGNTLIGAQEKVGQQQAELALIATNDPLVQAARPGTTATAKVVPFSIQPWQGPLDSAPKFAARPATVTLDYRQPVGLHVARDGSRAWLEVDSSYSVETATKRGVHSVDLRSSATLVLDLPEKRRVFGESLDGTAFLTIDTESGDRLDQFASDGRTLCAWRPSDNPLQGKVLYAATLGSDRALTLTKSGDLIAWSLPACEAVWKTTVPNAETATLSPGGKQVLVAHSKGVSAFDVETGEGLGTLPFDITQNPKVRIAVRGDGKQVVVSLARGVAISYRVWTLEDNPRGQEFAATGLPNRPLIHLGGDLFTDGDGVFDRTKNGLVWSLRNTKLVAVTAPADGRVWATLAPTPNSLLIVPARFPAAGVQDLIRQVDQSSEPILKPGSPINLELNFAGAPAAFAASARRNVDAALSKHGLAVDEDSPLTLRMRCSAQPTGETIQVNWRGVENLGKQETLKPYRVVCHSELVRNGQPVWTGTGSTFAMAIPKFGDIVVTDDSKTAAEFYARQVWTLAASWAGSPMAVPGNSVAMLNGSPVAIPGSSELTRAGFTTAWPAGFRPPNEPEDANGNPTVYSNPPTVAPPAAKNASGFLYALVGIGAIVFLFAIGFAILVWTQTRSGKSTPPRRPRRE